MVAVREVAVHSIVRLRLVCGWPTCVHGGLNATHTLSYPPCLTRHIGSPSPFASHTDSTASRTGRLAQVAAA